MKNNLIQTELDVNNNKIRVMRINDVDYISLTDLAKYSNPENPANVIIHWMSNKGTFDYIGLWEQLNNEKFNFTEFSEIKNKEVGYASFTLSPKRWIDRTNAIGIYSKGGKYSIGTFAHPDIAFEFASWLSPEFKLCLIKEFERLKKDEEKQIGWNAKRELAKINYRIHTDAIKGKLIPRQVTKQQTAIVYASEADVLNVALFGKTAKEWREQNTEKKGNIRDYATVNELICLSNLESLNAVFIEDGLPQKERLVKLNEIAIHQMIILEEQEEHLYLK